MRAKRVRSRRRRGSPKSPRFAWIGAIGWPVPTLLGVAFLLGGGGSRYGLLNLSVQLLALGLLVWLVHEAVATWRARPIGLKVLVVATLALPLLQLLPLPPAMWHALPGAELAVTTRSLIGAEGGWYPLSNDPQRTLIAFASLIPALAVICLMPARHGAAQMALRILVGLALLNFVVGTLQILGNQNVLLPYPLIEEGRLYGLFASHNTSGLFFVIGLCALYGVQWKDEADTRERIGVALTGAVLVLGTILTQSRSSNALLLVPLAAFALRALQTRRKTGQPIPRKYVSGAMALVVVLAVFGATNERIGQTLLRFEDLDDMRPEIWRDSWVALQVFFPLGSGIGSFDEIFQNFESLENVNPSYARRAHNDFLELGIETGIVGFLVMFGWMAWAALSWWRGRKCEEHREVDASALALLAIAAQSVLDYPLRNQALLCLAALLIAVLAARSTRFLDGVRE